MANSRGLGDEVREPSLESYVGVIAEEEDYQIRIELILDLIRKREVEARIDEVKRIQNRELADIDGYLWGRLDELKEEL